MTADADDRETDPDPTDLRLAAGCEVMRRRDDDVRSEEEERRRDDHLCLPLGTIRVDPTPVNRQMTMTLASPVIVLSMP